MDLAARAIALGLRVDLDCLNEELPPVVHQKKRFAFAEHLRAIIEHAPLAGEARKSLSTVDIHQVVRRRGKYTARFYRACAGPTLYPAFRLLPGLPAACGAFVARMRAPAHWQAGLASTAGARIHAPSGILKSAEMHNRLIKLILAPLTP